MADAGDRRLATNRSAASQCRETVTTATTRATARRNPRVLTESRRIQNREAQREYRKRQKQRLQDLERRVAESQLQSHQDPDAANTNLGLDESASVQSDELVFPDAVQIPSNDVLDPYLYQDPGLTSAVTPDLFAEVQPGISQSHTDNLEFEPGVSWNSPGLTLDSLFPELDSLSSDTIADAPQPRVTTTQEQSGTTYSLDEGPCMTSSSPRTVRANVSAEFDSQESSSPMSENQVIQTTKYHQLEEIFKQLTKSHIGLTSVLKAGMQVLGVSSSSHDVREQLRQVGTGTIQPPQITFNHFKVREIPLHEACLRNAAVLGVSARDALRLNFPSPFFHTEESNDAIQRSWRNCPASLQPTQLQMDTKHHFFLDTFPLASFRDKVIQLTSMSPPVFDLLELMLDLKTGLRCWGGAQVSGTGSASGITWDPRSWEFEPWAMTKWWFLIDQATRDQSKWWRSMRGENS